MNEKEKIKTILENTEVPEKLSPDSVKEMLDKSALPQKRNITIRHIVKAVSLAAALTLFIGVTGNLWRMEKQAKKQFSENSITGEAQHDCLEEDYAELLTNMKYAESYEEVYDYLNIEEIAEQAKMYDGMDLGAGNMMNGGALELYEDGFSVGSDDMLVGSVIEESENEDFEMEDVNSTGVDYTETYNQEEGVNEADIVKTDGENIYYCSYNSIRVAKVENGKFLSYDTIAENIGDIEQMYLYDDKLIVISYEYGSSNGWLNGFRSSGRSQTCITVYSKSDYQIIGQYSQNGYFSDIRLMDDGFMYLVTEETNYHLYGMEVKPEDTEEYIPSYVVNKEETYLGCSDILISSCNIEYNSSYINLSSFDLNSDNPCQPVDVKAVAGNAGDIYCSLENLYIAYGWEDTEITRFSINSGKIIPRAGTKVKGHIKDQFSMSEYNGYFRIATTYDLYNIDGLDGWTTNNCIYVLDMSLEQAGYITDLGRGEEIKSVSFDGNKGYVVTFRNTDPLYSIDLSDPENPVLMDELKITGYSSYMQKWQDGMLLGFGESGNEDGELYGLKLTMFDNSDPNNLEVIDSIEINSMDPDRFVYSVALYERKALLISPEHNIIGFPVFSDCWYTDTYQLETAYVFYSFENGKFKELGSIDYVFDEQELYDSYYYSGFDRAVIIEDYVYALSSEMFVSADTENLNQIDSCGFASDISDEEYVLD